MPFSTSTGVLLAATSLILGVMVIDCAYDVPALQHLQWSLMPTANQLSTAVSHPAISAMVAYYAHVTQVWFVGAAIISGIAVLACGVFYKALTSPSWRSIVLLIGLLVAAPYFILIMGPSEHAIGTAAQDEIMHHVLNILRGRVVIVTLCVAAFLLLITDSPVQKIPAVDKSKKQL